MEEKRNDQLQAVCAAAGALAVLAASLDSAKQWRSWVFVLLNILLLAILLTSKHAAFCSNTSLDDYSSLEECEVDSESESKRRLRREECQPEIEEDGGVKVISRKKKDQVEAEKEKVIECDIAGASASAGVSEKSMSVVLSNEELNERVEAFIATFRRQYLVCADVKGKTASKVCSSPVKNGGNAMSKSISVI